MNFGEEEKLKDESLFFGSGQDRALPITAVF